MTDATLPRDWRLTAISEVADVIMGQSPPSKTYNTSSDGLPFFQGKAEFGDETPVPVKWCTASTRIAEPDDILLSVRAPVGATNIASESCGIGRGLAALRSIPELLEPWYLLYALRLFEPLLVNRGQGSTFNAINRKNIESVKIPLPPLSEQRRIVDILRQTDDLRRLRREADAQMLHLQAALFCEIFLRDQEKLKQWDATKLEKRIIFITSGSRGWARYYADSGGKFIRVQNVLEGELNFDDLAFVQPPDGPDKERSRILPDDLLITITGTVGRVVVAPKDIGEAYVSQHVAIVRLDDSLNPHYVASYLNHPFGGQLRIARLNYGQTKPGLNLSQIQSLRVPEASEPLVQLFEQQAQEIKQIKQSQGNSGEFLDDLFQSLLARAFTGELTAAWREQPAEQLQEEATQRDIALGLRPRRRGMDFVAELDTPGGKQAFDQQIQEILQPTAEQLAKAITPKVRLGDILKIEPLVDLNKLLVSVLAEHQATVNASLLRGIELLSEATQETLAESARSVQALVQSAVEAHQQQMVTLAGQIAQMAALVTRRPTEDHPRYHSLRALSDEQYEVYLAALQSDVYFTAESLLDEDDLPVDNVRRTLALLETLGLVAHVNVPATPTGAAMFYVIAYRVPAPYDDSRDDDLAALEATFPGVAA